MLMNIALTQVMFVVISETNDFAIALLADTEATGCAERVITVKQQSRLWFLLKDFVSAEVRM